MSTGRLFAFTCLFTFAAAGSTRAQSPRVLYTWDGTGSVQDWAKAFGDLQDVTLENTTAGELTITETGATEGATVAIRDGDNTVAEGGASLGGLDLTGLEAIEFDLGHNGAGPVNVQFFVSATPAYNFVALGPDQAVAPGVTTYVAPLADLLPEQIAYIRVVGINIRDHLEEGNLVWTLREVRSTGAPLAQRDFASHEPGTPDGGLQGAYVNFGNVAVEGNDGQNQNGLSWNDAAPPAGNTGSLHWVDLGVSGGGGAITWVNGTAFGGNSFNERPTDMSNYTRLAVRLAATNVIEGLVGSVQVQYFLQTGNFNFHVAGSGQNLPADGEFHELSFPITAIPDLDFVDSHGLRIGEHLGGDLRIDVDYVRAIGSEPFPDCNRNNIPDERDLVDGTSLDCNRNARPDECDIAGGFSLDCNANGIPDECDVAGDDYRRVIYTWNGTGDARAWLKNFGANELEIVNEVEGELTVREIGDAAGTGAALSDHYNSISEFTTTVGGLDLVGMDAIEIDMGHGGGGDILVQFFIQATPAFTYIALGPDQAIAPGVKTYVAPLAGIGFEQLTYLRTIGINIRDHLAEGNVEWTIRELRATGVRLARRDYADHEPGATDGGLQGAAVTFDNVAVEGNDGGLNQTGLRHNVSNSPPGNTGSLQWTDLAGQNGGVVSWFNGTAFTAGGVGDTFNERPTDMSSYSKLLVRMAATSTVPGAVTEVGVLYFLQTGNFQYHAAGDVAALPADGEFYELAFPIAGVPDREFTDAHGLDIQDHPGGTVIIDVERIRAVREESGDKDCNGNGIPDDCDIADGTLADANANGVPDLCELAIFRRGDADGNSQFNITDAIRVLNVLFLGTGSISCLDAADSDDDGGLTITDAIRGLNVLFLGVGSIPPPGPASCGPDPTPDNLFGCRYEASSC
jgi:hypothetical protein